MRAASSGHVGAIFEISGNHLDGRHEQKSLPKALQWMKTQEGNPRIDTMRALLLMSQNESKFNQKGLELLYSLSLSGHAPASKFISNFTKLVTISLNVQKLLNTFMLVQPKDKLVTYLPFLKIIQRILVAFAIYQDF